MKRQQVFAVFLASAAFSGPAAALNPGLYEYVIKISMPGVPANMPAQTMQRCLTAKDVESNKAMEMPPMPDSDCKVQNQVIKGAQFSYRISCTKPEKIDGDVKGSVTATSINMEMNMKMADAPGPMMQNISARRLGDCK
jgi:hypothetical protein